MTALFMRDVYKRQGKEYQMLEMLMSNPGQVISPDLFMDKIWGYDSEAVSYTHLCVRAQTANRSLWIGNRDFRRRRATGR